eukprot:PhM_4_TR15338/c0_g1_i1/m.23770
MGLFDFTNFSVSASLEHSVFYPGNIIRGQAQISVKKPTKIRNVNLTFIGREKYRFSRQEGTGDNRRSRDYHGTADVVNTKLLLATSGSGGDFVMPSGNFTYPFEFTLPHGVPPSYVYKYGSDIASMEYSMCVEVDIPWGKDAEARVPFQVLSCVPRQQWQSDPPQSRTQDVNVSCCCCISKGSLMLNSWLQRSLLVMGMDPAYIRVDVQSKCKEPINSVNLILQQVNTTRHACGHPTDINRRVVIKHRQPTKIQPGQNAIVDLCFVVPRGILPTFHGIHVKSEYFLILEFDIPYASDPTVTFPVNIVQGIDDSNYFLPMQFTTPMYQAQAQPIQYVYQPPPTHTAPYVPMGTVVAPQPGLAAYQAPPPAVGVPLPSQDLWSNDPQQAFVDEAAYIPAQPPKCGGEGTDQSNAGGPKEQPYMK